VAAGLGRVDWLSLCICSTDSSGSVMFCLEHFNWFLPVRDQLACSILFYLLDFALLFLKTNYLVTFCS
jgi:hypothetical protein